MMISFLTVVAPRSMGQTTLEPTKPSEQSAEAGETTEPSETLAVESELIRPISDRLWLISSRGLTSSTCRADLEYPSLVVSRLSPCGRCERSSLEDYLQQINRDRALVVYVHGNRLDSNEAIERATVIYRKIAACRHGRPIDWVIWSWPSAKTGFLVQDFREKARRTDAQGLYLAWLLRKHSEASLSTSLIGYSFGGRVVTGALHALAGGSLGCRTLPGPAITGSNMDAGLIAPAIDSRWMVSGGYHGMATKNLDRLVLLYNRRDAVLKRYWLIEKVRGNFALGYTGPRAFGPRVDGSKLSVRSRDCARFVGLRHDEVDYYTSHCRAGSIMASLINDIDITH